MIDQQVCVALNWAKYEMIVGFMIFCQLIDAITCINNKLTENKINIDIICRI